MIENILNDFYGLCVRDIKKSTVGAGSDTYLVTCAGDNERYVLKFPCESEMNNPDVEPPLCEFLLKSALPVSEFMRNKYGDYISKDETGRKLHVQKFVEGKTHELNSAPHWLLNESGRTLGKIHKALADYHGLPEGIGKNFFRYMTPSNALNSYKATLKLAKERGDTEIEAGVSFRIELMSRFPNYDIDIDQLTCQCTHGDYFISQLICGENKINAVIDWTTACVHPIAFEVIRSYVYASPSCINGEINIPEFVDYVSEYLLFKRLNNYDIEMMAKLFYYQISVCDYYNQYYQSTSGNRYIYLHQAVFSTKLMKWFDKNINTLTEALHDHFFA